MHQEVRLHGHANQTIEYFATAAARDAYRNYFYEFSGEGLRFFCPGSEFLLQPDGVEHRGNGGSFCEYMFGVDQPLADLAKGDVRNRLILYGATYHKDGELVFTPRTEGKLSYEKIFLEGNAVCNYFFFVAGPASGNLEDQQERLLRLLGKRLKRTSGIGPGDDTELIQELVKPLGERTALYLIKLIHKKHKAYHDTFRDLYLAHKKIPDEHFYRLKQLATELEIDRYQQERIRIDVMYKHPDNRRIVDEYKHILIDCNRRGQIAMAENARLTRLKTLSVRKKIPPTLFYTLDEMLKHDKLVHFEEQGYLAETRQILEGILLHEREIDASVDREDMIKLLHAKRQASDNRDHNFEQILLETGKACDEKIRDGASISLLENFSYIVTFFDRYDATQSNINQLAFMENVHFSEEMVRSLIGNRKAFEELAKGLFDEIFFSGILDNKYLGKYGRLKVQTLQLGLKAIEDGRLTIGGLLEQVEEIAGTERLYHLVLDLVKEHIRNFYSRYNTRAEQDALRLEITSELQDRGQCAAEVPKALFRDVLDNIKKEAIYLHNLLPEILAEKNSNLREDFLDNSGLDRFYVEELEREYVDQYNIDPELLNQIRKGLTN